MKQAAKVAGTGKDETKQTILESELNRLQEMRSRIKEGNQRYVERHPELRTLMDEFVAATIAQKPNDIIKFGAKWFSSLREGQVGFCPLIVTGTSGAGTSTLVNRLIKAYPKLFYKPLETTTRIAKDYEVDGEDFNFVDETKFNEIRDKGDFIWWTPVYENFYGLTLEAVEKIIEEGKIAIFDLPYEKLESYRNSILDIKYMFISPPSIDMLEDRLISMQKYNPNVIEEKIESASEQIEKGMSTEFDGFITNDDLDVAYNEFVYQLIAWYVNADIDPPPPVIAKASSNDSAGVNDEKSIGTAKSNKSKKSQSSTKK
jgi:guanylate kinase